MALAKDQLFGKIAALVFLLLAVSLARAGQIKAWQLDQLAKAKTLGVVRVEAIIEGRIEDAEKVPWKSQTRICSASLTVIRKFGASPDSDRIGLEYYCKIESRGSIQPPSLPTLQAGRVYLLPLNCVSSACRLIDDDGEGLVMPAVSDLPAGEAAVSASEFLLRELSNDLVHGTYATLYATAQWLRWQQSSTLPDRLFAEAAARIPGTDIRRWLDISTACLATLGIPRVPTSELISSGQPYFPFSMSPAGLAARALRQVPPEQRTEGLIRNMLEHSDVHDWGSAATLVPEFKNDRLLLDLLPGYLSQSKAGALYVALWLARNGTLAILQPALSAASRAVRSNQISFNDLNAACTLIIRYGTNEQFAELLAVFERAKSADVARYKQLWDASYSLEVDRMLRVIGILITDERVLFEGVRYCDIAGARLQALSGESFGFGVGGQDVSARDAAVLRARNWLREHSALPPSSARETTR